MKIKLKKNSPLRKIILVVILLLVVLHILRYAAYFKRDNYDSISVIIQNLAYAELAHDVYIDENDVVYLSENDVKEYLDQELYYEKNENNSRRYISVSQNKILDITENENHMFINSNREKIKGAVIEREGVYYFPISELEKAYNIEVDYLKDKKKVNIEKLSEEKITAVVNREMPLKYKMTNISKDVITLEPGDTVTIIQNMDKGWVKVKTTNYDVGYVKKSKLINEENERYSLPENDHKDFNIENSTVIEVNDATYTEFNTKIAKYDDRQVIIQDVINKASNEILKQPESIGIKINITTVQDIENYYKFLNELKARANDLGIGVIVTNQSGMDKTKLENSANVVL